MESRSVVALLICFAITTVGGRREDGIVVSPHIDFFPETPPLYDFSINITSRDPIRGGRRADSRRGLVVCGKNQSRRTSQAQICQLRITSRDRRAFNCTGWMIGRKYIATAGHCLLDDSGRWMAQIIAYCNAKFGQVTTATKTFEAVRFAVTEAYFEFQRDPANRQSTMWADAGIIKIHGDFPKAWSPYRYGHLSCRGSTRATVSGHPGTSFGTCSRFQGAPWRQYSSTGSLRCKVDRMGFLQADTDTCGGHSGSPVRVGSEVVGIHTGGVAAPGNCWNLVTRIKDGSPKAKGKGVKLQPIIKFLASMKD